ncbi:hypothetical protein [Bradyrhizobium genosp. A]|uniref:hypothetical protein n=1 Tax=Bradyrhizobium genosp. A TaxID=83626 RepID=UPI003CE746CD
MLRRKATGATGKLGNETTYGEIAPQIRCDSQTAWSPETAFDAAWFIEGPIDGMSFRTYVEKVFLPVLRPGDIVILDRREPLVHAQA